jgi:cytochrome c
MIKFAAFCLGTVALLPSGAFAQEGDPTRGEELFKRNCASCHMIGRPAINGPGPVLNGIVGRPAGSYPDYNYSEANRQSGVTWDVESLTTYLFEPRAFIPDTKMPFEGFVKNEDIADVVAYLSRFGPDGNPIASD